jgi:predicted ATPase/DNA-binding SARP family transcriptional activator
VTWLRVLGPLEICVGSGASAASAASTLTVSSPRMRRLLAALVVRANEVASPDWLADAVWNDEQPANLEAALQTLISRLRSLLRQANQLAALDAGVELVTRAPGYLVELGLDQLDASQFEELARRGLREADSDPARALASLDAAQAWWRGPAYAEFAESDFARPEAVRLGELHAGVVVDRLDLLLRLGRHQEAASSLEGLVTAQPLSERPHSLLMLARYRDGRHQAALDLYADFRGRLSDELGLEPSAAIQQLHAQILRQDAALTSHPRAVARQSATGGAQDDDQARSGSSEGGRRVDDRGRSTGNLPGGQLDLVGRDAESSGVADAIRAGAVVTVTGPGGVGKTSLARGVGVRRSAAFPDGVWWCELAAVSEPDAVAHAIRTTLGAPPRPGASTLDRLVDYLRSRRAFLILDNCEHIVGAAAEAVEQIHRHCPEVAILATSRMPLDVNDEQVWSLAPLPTPAPDEHEVAAIEAEPSVQLFVARAQAQTRHFALAADNAHDVAEICRRLDGLPLALELAASRMRTMQPADLVDRLSWRFRLLHGGARGADERHRTLRSVVDWSYELLEPAEQRVFDILSVFAGAFTLDDAEELVGRVLQLTETSGIDRDFDPADGTTSGLVLDLVDRSMVSLVRGTDLRYQLLETIRAYGRERLAQGRHAEAVARAHAELFADLADAAVREMFGPLHVELVEELASHIDEQRAAFTWSIDNNLALAARLVAGMPPYVENRMSAEVAHWALRTIGVADAQGRRPPGIARVHAVAASGARFAGALDEARLFIERGIAVADDQLTRAYLVYLSAEIALFEGRFEDAWSSLAELRRLDAEGDIGGFRQFADVVASLLLAYGGELENAAATADKLRSDADLAGNLVLAAWATYTQAEARLDTEPEHAMDLLDDALNLARASGDRYLTGVALVSAASVRSRHGDPREALQLFRDVVLHWHSSGNWLHQWTTLRNLVDLLVRLERDDDAAVLIGALESRSSSVEPFGDEARRFDAATQTLAIRLGPDPWRRLRGAGAVMRDNDVVAFVVAILTPPPPVDTT